MWHRRKAKLENVELEIGEAQQRLESAQESLAEAKRDNSRVDEVARRMHEIRQANRFATLMRQALRGNE